MGKQVTHSSTLMLAMEYVTPEFTTVAVHRFGPENRKRHNRLELLTVEKRPTKSGLT